MSIISDFIRSFLSFFRFLHTHRDLLISSRADRWNSLCEIRFLHSCSKLDIFVEIWSFLSENSNSIKFRTRNMREKQILIECETVNYFKSFRFFFSFFSFRSLHTHRDLLISSRANRWDLFCEIRLLHFCSKFDIFAEIWLFLFENSNSIKSRTRNRLENQNSIR